MLIYKYRNKKKKKLMTFLFITLVVLSNFSQLPSLVSINATSLLSIPTWLVLGFLLLIFSNLKIKLCRGSILFYKLSCLFIILVIILSIFTGNSQYSSSLFRAFIISLMVFSVGCISNRFLTQRIIDNMQIFYILTLIIIGFSIYLQYFIAYDISSITYGYNAKNSISTMLLAAIVFLVFRPNNFKHKLIAIIIRFCLVVYFIILMGLLKSRASLIGLSVILFAILVNKRIKKSRKVLIVIIITAIIIYILNDKNLYQLILHDIIYAGRDANNISSLSSGRTDLIANTLQLLYKNPLIGLGAYYIDCFPVSAWANFGFIIGTILIIISLCPLIFTAKSLKNPLIYIILDL